MINGIINVYKECGYTSHDVVAKLRVILKQKKIGHTGTLDPEAQGVLPVCLGNGTKVCELLTDKIKEYRAVLLLGTVTDTQDLTGTVIQNAPVNCTEEELLACISGFVGTQEQIPPMYSALKVNGKKLYDLARQGIEVERRPRTITIEKIQVEEIRFPEVVFTVRCSKGTYIRTLCHDIGAVLGCGGCMKELLRTQVGPFLVKDSVRLDEIVRYRDQGELGKIVQPTDSVFMQFPSFTLTAQMERMVRNGNPLPQRLVCSQYMQEAGEEACAAAGTCDEKSCRLENPAEQLRLYSPDGEFLAIYGWNHENACYKAVKMFL